MRSQRLDAEYEEALAQFQIALQNYEELEQERNESRLFKRIPSRKEAPPTKPVRRK